MKEKDNRIKDLENENQTQQRMLTDTNRQQEHVLTEKETIQQELNRSKADFEDVYGERD